MANTNVPFSVLPTVTGLDGSEVVPLDQAGTTKTATIRQIANAAIQSSVIGNPLVINNDTNVTAALGGPSSIALLSSAIINLGWTGTLSSARLNANVVQTVSNDTNVTGVISSQNLQLGWAGGLSVARGGTGQASFSSHGVLLGAGTSALGLATVGTSGAIFVDQGGSADPAFKVVSGDASINSSGVLTIASNAIGNTKLAQMASNTVKGNASSATANAADLTRAQLMGLAPSLNLIGFAAGVNFNSANTDTAITLTLPSSFSVYDGIQVAIYSPSAALNTATFGLFTATGGTSIAVFSSGTVITITSTQDGSNNNAMVGNANNVNTQAYSVTNFSTLYFRVGTPQGSAATASVAIYARVLP